ncbi:MAG: hypothetical protein E7270_06040 [Lachnospiraceae bacterium]|nr:hypothetical protein [Lachnospiraceae bacterium]
MRKLVCLLMLSTFLIGCSNSQEKENNASKINESTSTTVSQESESLDDFENETEQEEVILTYKDEEVAKAYREVLKSERSFVSTDENNEVTYMNEFDYFRGEQDKDIQEIGFELMDINGDGNYEVSVNVISREEDGREIENELLYYVDDIVYGYQLPEWMYFWKNNVVHWDAPYVYEYKYLDYSGCAEINIKGTEVVFTYVFEKPGSEDEIWLRESGLIRDEDSIKYVGEEYEKYTQNASDYHYSIADGNGYREVDKYITAKAEERKDSIIGAKNKDIAKAYREVLKNERSFISVDEDNEVTYLNEFDYIAGIDCISTHVSLIKVADIGDDDNYEVVVDIWGDKRYPKDKADTSERVVEILSYEDGTVYGYQLPNWMYVVGDSVVSWNNVGTPGYIPGDENVEGNAVVKIENHELVYTYFFEEEGSKEEEWLRNSGIMSDKDSIIYVGKDYYKYIYSGYKYNVSIDGRIDEEDIDRYIR